MGQLRDARRDLSISFTCIDDPCRPELTLRLEWLVTLRSTLAFVPATEGQSAEVGWRPLEQGRQRGDVDRLTQATFTYTNFEGDLASSGETAKFALPQAIAGVAPGRHATVAVCVARDSILTSRSQRANRLDDIDGSCCDERRGLALPEDADGRTKLVADGGNSNDLIER